MAKKTNRQEAEEAEVAYWFQWEFLRRNPKYRKDYEVFMREFGSWFRKHGLWYDTVFWPRKEWKFYGRSIAPHAQRICEKWHVIEVIPPDWKFSHSGLHKYRTGVEVALPTGHSRCQIRKVWEDMRYQSQLTRSAFKKTLPANTNLPQTEEHRIRYYSLRLDFAQALPLLLAQARQEISQRKHRYDRAHPKPPRITSAKRRRLDQYEQYLRIWDLRAQGETFVAIGAQLFPGQLESAQRAKDNYRSAMRLIMGGYKDLR